MPDQLRILLVEDDMQQARLMEAQLRRQAACDAIDHAADLESAVAALRRRAYDAMLLDLTLPDCAGLTTLRRVRAVAPDTPLVVLTGRADEDLGASAVAAGAQDFVVKGRMDADGVMRALRYAVARHQVQVEKDKADARELESRSLQALDAMRRDLFNSFAHELRTPLTPLPLQLHLLRRSIERGDLDKARRAADALERGTVRLQSLVENVLDIARLDAAQLKITKVPFDLEAIVTGCVDTYRPVAEGHQIRLDAEVKELDVVVEGDADRIAQVLDNLVDNALVWSPPGARVDVQVKAADDAVTFSVQDAGRGLSAKERGRLFRPFSQVAEDERPRGRGSGLGLHICKGIIEAHGGTIGCDSEGVGHGSTFWFRLPVAPGRVTPALPA